MDELNRKIKIISKTKATTQNLLRRKCQHAIRSCSVILTICWNYISFTFCLLDWSFTSYSRMSPPPKRFFTEPSLRFLNFWQNDQISNIPVFTVCIRRRVYEKNTEYLILCAIPILQMSFSSILRKPIGLGDHNMR